MQAEDIRAAAARSLLPEHSEADARMLQTFATYHRNMARHAEEYERERQLIEQDYERRLVERKAIQDFLGKHGLLPDDTRQLVEQEYERRLVERKAIKDSPGKHGLLPDDTEHAEASTAPASASARAPAPSSRCSGGASPAARSRTGPA